MLTMCVVIGIVVVAALLAAIEWFRQPRQYESIRDEVRARNDAVREVFLAAKAEMIHTARSTGKWGF